MLEQPSKEEVTKFCLDLQQQRPGITKEEITSLLVVYLKKYRAKSEQAKVQDEKVSKGNICSACGVDNEPLVAFCTACGKKNGEKDILLENNKVEHESQIQGTTQEESDKLEEKIMREQNICKSCGAELENDAAFCVTCGKSTSESDVKKKKHHFVGTICSQCERSIEIRQAVTVCPKCGEAHHSECWKENNYTCTMPSCGGRDFVEPLKVDKPVAFKIQDSNTNQTKDHVNTEPSERVRDRRGVSGKLGVAFISKAKSTVEEISNSKKKKIVLAITVSLLAFLLPIWLFFSNGHDLGITFQMFKNNYNQKVNKNLLINEFEFLQKEKNKWFIGGKERGDTKLLVMGQVGTRDNAIRFLWVELKASEVEKQDRIDIHNMWFAVISVLNPEMSKKDIDDMIMKLLKSGDTIITLKNVKYRIRVSDNDDAVALFAWNKNEDFNTLASSK